MCCLTVKFLDNEQCGILRTLPNYSPRIMSRNSAIHPSHHIATRMKKTTTNLARISTQSLDQFWDLDDMFLKICILVFVGLNTAVEPASPCLLSGGMACHTLDGAALLAARRRKQRRYPELASEHGRARLVV